MTANLNITRLYDLARTEKQAFPCGIKPENRIGNILSRQKGFTPVVGNEFDNMLMITGIPVLIRNISGNTQDKYIIRLTVSHDSRISVAGLCSFRYIGDID